MNLLTDAYVAGLIDGEGCISIHHRKLLTFYPRVDVGMTVKALPLLNALAERYGGAVRKARDETEVWAEAHCWQVLGKPVLRLLRAIQPHLVIKARQCELALRMQMMLDALPKRPNGFVFWTDEARRQGAICRLLVMEENRKGPADKGAPPGWIARRVGYVWLTPQRDLVSPTGWVEFSGTFPRSGTMQNGRLYERPTWVHRIAGSASSSSPTDEPRYWPTPDAGNFNDGQSLEVWKERHERELAKGYNGNGGGENWPTPQARDEKGPTGMEGRLESGGRRSSLSDSAMPGEVAGRLNPTWVEGLMNFPLGWTEVHLADAKKARPAEVVRALPPTDDAHPVQRDARGYGTFSPAEILLPCMLCPRLAVAISEAVRAAQADGPIPEECLRGLLGEEGSGGSPQGRGLDERGPVELPDPVRLLSHAVALAAREEAEPEARDELQRMWQGVQGLGAREARYVLVALSALAQGERLPQVAGPGEPQHDWEPPRTVTEKTPNRPARLHALGNAVLPPCGEFVGWFVRSRWPWLFT